METTDQRRERWVEIIAVLLVIFVAAPLAWNFVVVATFPVLPTVPFYFFMALRLVLVAILSSQRTVKITMD